MKKVLLVEPDGARAQAIESALVALGYLVYAVDLGEEAIDLARSYKYDVVLMNVDLPDMASSDVVRELSDRK